MKRDYTLYLQDILDCIEKIDIAKMRDKIIHFYFGVDYEIVWKVIKERLPVLEPKLKQMLMEEETR